VEKGRGREGRTWLCPVYHNAGYTLLQLLQLQLQQQLQQQLGGAAVWRRTPDRKVAGSTPGQDAIKSTRSTQPSIPPGR